MSTSFKDTAYDHIRGKLLAGQLRPGTRLSNRGLAQEIGVSVIPIREAMSQLVSEGLLEHKPKVGTFVVEVSGQEMLDLCELREALESYAAGKAAKRITEIELAEMEACWQKMRAICAEVERDGWTLNRTDRWRLADAGFHLALLRAAGNRRALKTVSDLRVMTYVFGHQDDEHSLGDPARACDEHRRIIEAIRKADGTEARAVMAEHLHRASRIVLDVYERRRRQGSATASPSDSFSVVLRQRIHALEEDAPAEDSEKENE